MVWQACDVKLTSVQLLPDCRALMLSRCVLCVFRTLSFSFSSHTELDALSRPTAANMTGQAEWEASWLCKR